MATQKQIEANRRNARKSTGPRTAAGKARVSRNAAKNRLFERRMLLPGEHAEEYEALVRDLENDLKPNDALERALVRQIGDAEWRLHRAVDLETGLFSAHFERLRQFRGLRLDQALGASQRTELLGGVLMRDAADDTLSKLSRYEMRLSRRYFTALAHLEALQERRRKRSKKSARKTLTKQSQ